MKLHIRFLLLLLICHSPLLAMEESSNTNTAQQLSHDEKVKGLVKKILDQYVKVGFEITKSTFENEGYELPANYSENGMKIVEDTYSLPLRTFFVSWTDDDLSALFHYFDNDKIVLLTKELGSFAIKFAGLQKRAEKNLQIKPILPDDRVGKVCKAMEPKVQNMLNIPYIGKNIAHNMVYLFYEDIMKKYGDEIKILDEIEKMYPTLDSDIRALIAKHESEFQRQIAELFNQ